MPIAIGEATKAAFLTLQGGIYSVRIVLKKERWMEALETSKRGKRKGRVEIRGRRRAWNCLRERKKRARGRFVHKRSARGRSNTSSARERLLFE
mgnify:CR=1 FL=1